jgi:hypothetical protein
MRTNRHNEPHTGTDKVVKVRKGHRDDVVSFFGNNQRKGTVAHQMLPHRGVVGRSVVADSRGYARGPVTVRGAGRDTGIVNTTTPSARADVAKIPARGRAIEFGRVRLPGDPI